MDAHVIEHLVDVAVFLLIVAGLLVAPQCSDCGSSKRLQSSEQAPRK